MVGFFDIIQAYFTQITGRFIMFSGRDMALLRAWRMQGATPGCICRGIREAVLHMQDGPPPRNIYNCRKFIIPHVERAGLRALDHVARKSVRPLSIGRPRTPRKAASIKISGPKVPAKTPRKNTVFGKALGALEHAGRSCDDECVREIYRDTWYALSAQMRTQHSVEYQYEHLLRLEDELTQRVFDVMAPETRAQIDAELDEQDKTLPMRMSPEAWHQHRTARRHRVLVKAYGLVKLLD